MFIGFIKQFFRDVRSQKLRLFLTFFGIVWGTTSVALLLVFGESLEKHLMASMRGIGENIVICWPSRTSRPWQGLPKGRAIRMTEDDIDILEREVPELTRVSSEYQAGYLRLKVGRNVVVPTVTGARPSFSEIRNMIPEEGGRYINKLDMDQRRRSMFIGDELKESLFGRQEAVGKRVFVNGVPFLVTGVMKEKDQDSNYNGRDADKASIAASTFRALYGRNFINNFVFQTADAAEVPAAITKVRETLARKYKFDPKDEESIMMWDTTEFLQFIGTFCKIFQLFLGITGVLTLVVGGIGVSNIMNVVVEERTKEIGIKMALGAKRGYVVGQLMTETAFITLSGGLVGFAICWAICAVLPAFNVSEFIGTPVVSWQTTAITTSVLGVICFLAGFFPARHAASLNPVEALRM